MTRFERWAIWSTSAATAITGLVYAWMKYLMTPSQPWAVVNHPLQPLVLKAHILVAPLLVFAVGLITSRHVWRHVRGGVRTARRSGLVSFLSLAPMVLSGYLLQTATGALWLRGLAVAHIGLGLVYTVGMVAHRVAAPGRGRGRGAMAGTVDAGPPFAAPEDREDGRAA